MGKHFFFKFTYIVIFCVQFILINFTAGKGSSDEVNYGTKEPQTLLTFRYSSAGFIGRTHLQYKLTGI